MNLLSLIPSDTNKDAFIISDSKILQMLQSVAENETFCNFEDSYTVQGRDPELHQSCFLHVVTETVYHYPHNSYGEKTWKPIVNLRPFVLVSVPGALSELQSLGFKTFSSWWNEDYDNIQDPVARMQFIVAIVKQISQQSTSELQSIYTEMKPILTHNYEHYYGNFRTQALVQFENDCKKNLLPR